MELLGYLCIFIVYSQDRLKNWPAGVEHMAVIFSKKSVSRIGSFSFQVIEAAEQLNKNDSLSKEHDEA